jgi:hypothetical protein
MPPDYTSVIPLLNGSATERYYLWQDLVAVERS